MQNFIEINMKEELERKVRQIFNKDVITKNDVLIANRLIEQWKKITNYYNTK